MEASKKTISQENRKMNMMEQRESIPPCLICIDKEGRWFHQGVEMIHRDFIQLFYQNMELDPEGRYLINWRDTRCYVEVEDTAFVVTRVAFNRGSGHEPPRFEISLSDDTQEILVPATLRVGKDHVLYCDVKSNVFPARFARAAYYQLAEFIQEDDVGYFLLLNNQKHYIAASDT